MYKEQLKLFLRASNIGHNPNNLKHKLSEILSSGEESFPQEKHRFPAYAQNGYCIYKS